jgi:hypothetical protein
MGMQGDGVQVKTDFIPNTVLMRAEAGTILSRLLRGTQYATTEANRYQKHLEALREEEIMKSISTPMMKELRGNMFIMLMRMSFSSKN